MNQVLTVESYLEFDTCFHLEYSASISSFIAQPEGFTYRFEGREHSYTPDFYIVENKERKWMEVKPFRKTQNPEFLEMFRAKQAKAQQIGIPLLLVTEKQIRVNPVLNNLKILHRYSGFQDFTDIHIKLLSLVKLNGKISIFDAASYLNIDLGLMIKVAFSLVSQGVLQTNLVNEELSISSLIWSK
ncbi:Tn7 transposase TnsA N-terminal domain-containing protein [Photobacterium sp. ZSDE20]|uniref:Tn7 transposase TnsA N-terminal domain-containing protein n=1 Tax=Photobacterium pectinilyticum TaxID=2906793 RepID=A0ABT1N4B4_9GAMM|nr:Tn7 transposase TnsA N-terminal domain-containing protein [Photobacterium sp. ZSDE20]MCQ1059572.1 Tn7 transposase TnsA N-terminal domain-containing protein [Photobacterium sp. ZSDE20]MDD1825435.1 Tn7 transposase TnsA N-terminal domain-containing protein [Photobacterium sp. ZSDE20]